MAYGRRPRPREQRPEALGPETLPPTPREDPDVRVEQWAVPSRTGCSPNHEPVHPQLSGWRPPHRAPRTAHRVTHTPHLTPLTSTASWRPEGGKDIFTNTFHCPLRQPLMVPRRVAVLLDRNGREGWSVQLMRSLPESGVTYGPAGGAPPRYARRSPQRTNLSESAR